MEDLKRCIEKAAEFLDRAAGVADENGVVLYATTESLVGQTDPEARRLVDAGETLRISEHQSYHRLSDPSRADYICFVEGTDTVSQTYLGFLSNWILAVLRDGTNEADRRALIKNILLENELPGDIPLKAREHHIPYAAPRVVYIVRVPGAQSMACQTVMNELFPVRRADFMMTMDEANIVLVKELGEDPKRQVSDIAVHIMHALTEADIGPVHIGIGMMVETLKDCARSYREASLALTIGDIFDPNETLMYYNRLGLGRLIYQLPPTLCRMFLDEVFPHDSYEELDDETLLTIDKFFENNLNGSETSRQLFVHRNTLVYRLDKVQKTTDLDLRNFDDAVLFKLASMVRKYLEKQEPGALTGVSRWQRI